MTHILRGFDRPVAARLSRGTLLAVGLALALGGCEDTRKVLGMDKNPPDEFKIVSRPPLVMPPDFGLRPPQPGAARPQQDNPTETARSALLEAGGGSRPGANQAQASSEGESAILSRVASGTRVDPSIRQTLDRETSQLAAADGYLLDRLMFWRKPEEQGVIIDPAKEQQRLRENQALGRPATSGDTPTIQRRSRSILEGLF